VFYGHGSIDVPHFEKKKNWQACKPGSVSSVNRRKTFIIYLVKTLLFCSCSLPLLTSLCEKETKRAAMLYRNSGKQSGYIWLCNP
jgi:hypothetical protein